MMHPQPSSSENLVPAQESVVPIQNDPADIHQVTVCLRPFRPAGPRLDVERVGSKIVLHNYGHGGSGWSLSWGSASVVVQKLAQMAAEGQRIAVIGCGAIGITSAVAAQRAGLCVTIYAKDQPPFVSSLKATGTWTPDSRVALTQSAGPGFADLWETMARTSFRQHESYLQADGQPVERTERYTLYDSLPKLQTFRHPLQDSHGFVFYEDRLCDITSFPDPLSEEANPFPVPFASRTSTLTFNLSAYTQMLLQEFHERGGTVEPRTFGTPQDLLSLEEQIIVNCTGYGAKQLWSDKSIIPIRGQIALLPAQSDVHYGLLYNNLRVVARRDGIVVQPSPAGDDTGWNETDETPDPDLARAGVEELRRLMQGMKSTRYQRV